MKKYLPKIFLPIAGMALILPNFAHAWSPFSIADVASNAIGWILFTINFVISYILGALLAFIASFVSIFLTINNDIGSTSVVRLGLGATSSLVMFFFVLAFVWIALRYMAGLIGRNEKGVFVRLIAALILVNFLPAPILPTLEAGPERLSAFFMDNFAPQTPGTINLPGSSVPSMAFTNALVGAFAPQKMFIINANTNDLNFNSNVTGATAKPSGGLSDILKPLVGIFVSIIYLLVVCLIMLVLLIMLAVRYVMLTLLYIFVPFVVLAWVFPAFRHLWRNWWTSFIRWTFYPTIVLLGLYLSIMAAQYMKDKNDKSFAAVTGDNGKSSISAAVDYMNPKGKGSDPAGDLISVVLTPIMQGIVIVGLAIGGLIAADKMSIHLSETTVTAGEFVGGKIGQSMSNSGRARRVFNNIRQRTASSTRTPLRPPMLMMPPGRGGGGGPPAIATAVVSGKPPLTSSQAGQPRVGGEANAGAKTTGTQDQPILPAQTNEKLERKLRGATALWEGATTDGEREAAAAAMQRIKDRMSGATSNTTSTAINEKISPIRTAQYSDNATQPQPGRQTTGPLMPIVAMDSVKKPATPSIQSATIMPASATSGAGTNQQPVSLSQLKQNIGTGTAIKTTTPAITAIGKESLLDSVVTETESQQLPPSSKPAPISSTRSVTGTRGSEAVVMTDLLSKQTNGKVVLDKIISDVEPKNAPIPTLNPSVNPQNNVNINELPKPPSILEKSPSEQLTEPNITPSVVGIDSRKPIKSVDYASNQLPQKYNTASNQIKTRETASALIPKGSLAGSILEDMERKAA